MLVEVSFRPPSARVQVGRWHLRTWPSHVMRLPRGYREPIDAFLVEETDEAGDDCSGQFAGFTSEEEARRLCARLVSEGRLVRINHVLVYARERDYDWNR